MFKKNTTLFILLAILVISLTACSSPENSVQETAAEAEVSAAEAPAEEAALDDVIITDNSYPVVDTDQTWCFSDSQAISCGEAYLGQDAQYEGLQPAYQDNGDGTITDLNTGLMWIQDAGEKKYYADAMEELETYTFAGYDDWRLPTIKELYSLALFSGVDASMASSSDVEGLWPLIDEDYFVFLYGDETNSSRVIDAQWLSSTIYNSTVMGNQSCFFGFNFSDGRIKCYGLTFSPTGGYFAQYVRGGDDYGVNDFEDNGDGTITDNATGLIWTQNDNGEGLQWGDALDYCEALSLGGSDDWRLPNIKELHSIVDYSRSPDITNSAAIDPLFNLTPITNEAGQADYGFYWSSTTLISYPDDVGAATYISFGRALGYMNKMDGWVDVHGAGAQRSDPKVDSGETYEYGLGPQGDAVRMYNYTFCVSGGVAEPSSGDDPSTLELSSVFVEMSVDGEVPTSGEGRDTQQAPDLAAAAVVLGITEQELMDALGPPPPDLQAAAETLGITVEELRNALEN